MCLPEVGAGKTGSVERVGEVGREPGRRLLMSRPVFFFTFLTKPLILTRSEFSVGEVGYYVQSVGGRQPMERRRMPAVQTAATSGKQNLCEVRHHLG